MRTKGPHPTPYFLLYAAGLEFSEALQTTSGNGACERSGRTRHILLDIASHFFNLVTETASRKNYKGDENRRAFLKGAGALTAIAAIGTVNPAHLI